MRGTRVAMMAPIALLAGLLSACGDDFSDVPPVAETTSSSRVVEGEFTSAQQDVIDAARAYVRAIETDDGRSIDERLDGLYTGESVERVIAAEKSIAAEGYRYSGSTKLTPEDVTINGDSAVLTGCSDPSGTLLVKGDADQAEGARTLGEPAMVRYTLTKVEGRWRMSDPFSTGKPC